MTWIYSLSFPFWTISSIHHYWYCLTPSTPLHPLPPHTSPPPVWLAKTKKQSLSNYVSKYPAKSLGWVFFLRNRDSCRLKNNRDLEKEKINKWRSTRRRNSIGEKSVWVWRGCGLQRTKKVPSAGVVSRTRIQSKSREWGWGRSWNSTSPTFKVMSDN